MAAGLGVFFGPRLISVVQTRGNRVVNYLKISRAALGTGESEEKVPEDVKIVAAFSEELRKNKIEAREVTIGLSGKDLIVRTFELPILPPNEIATAVNFEAKKYIPFKVEDLVSDFQVIQDKGSKKNIVLFVGIKKEILEKYLSIFKQLNIKLNNIEYSAFSLLRFLKMGGIGHKGISGIISMDSKEEDEASFTVLENGFPIFSRDITLVGSQEEAGKSAETDAFTQAEKLKTEIRISLDYYNRKFLLKKIRNMYFMADENFRGDLESFMKEMELPFQFINTDKYIGKIQPYSLGFIKGFGCALARSIRTNFKINLLSPKPKVKFAPAIPKPGEAASFFTGVKIDFRFVWLGLIICAFVYGFGFSRMIAKERDLSAVISLRPQVKGISSDLKPDELKKIDSEYKNKMNVVEQILKKQAYFTTSMELLSRIIPEDMSLDDFSFKREKDGKVEITLKGIAYLGDSEKELSLVNTFVSKLKENTNFIKDFKNIRIVSVQQKQVGKMTVSSFTISCKSE